MIEWFFNLLGINNKKAECTCDKEHHKKFISKPTCDKCGVVQRQWIEGTWTDRNYKCEKYLLCEGCHYEIFGRIPK